MGDAVEEVKPAVIKKDNRKEEQGFLVEDSVHKTLKDLNEESGGARITYDQKAIYDLMRIREMDKLLWITRKDEDLSLNWTVENGEYIVHSVKAIHNVRMDMILCSGLCKRRDARQRSGRMRENYFWKKCGNGRRFGAGRGQAGTVRRYWIMPKHWVKHSKPGRFIFRNWMQNHKTWKMVL